MCSEALYPEKLPVREVEVDEFLARQAPRYALPVSAAFVRHRPAAPQRETIDTATAHIGFRCIMRGERSELLHD
jgi:hypothetical protein